ncbi:MAG: nucleotidyltransferase family protein [Planctomycetes bacterium]|nr:nucleotidyltransferase family protein [Planctomycetota bacterium]
MPHNRDGCATTGRLFAVIPAAGRSRRMGRPKLLLPLAGETVIARLLAVLDRPEIAARLVVVRPHDDALADEVARSGGTVVRPEVPPPQMRDSVEAALSAIRERWNPQLTDAWLLVPADHPVLSAEVVDALIDCWQRGGAAAPPPLTKGGNEGGSGADQASSDSSHATPPCPPLVRGGVPFGDVDRGRIVVPTCRGRRGHPVLFPWSLSDRIFALPPEAGLNRLVRDCAGDVVEIEVADESILIDLDTPEDYDRLLKSAQG